MADPSNKVAFPDPSDRMPTILVVEDELLVRLNLSDYLQECGFKVLEARDADEAIVMIEEGGVEIDLVFSDVEMPGSTNGFGLAKWIRENRPGLAVILTSGDAKRIMAAKELCESEPFLAKPYDLKIAVAQIRSHLEKAKTSADQR